ncbi:MAG: IclR family transcriptional regulator [Bryobacteraceae bacterium]
MRRERKARPVGVLTKALQIMDLVRASSSPLTLHDINGVTGINKSTALRLLAHLETQQYLSRDVRGAYSSGPQLVEPRAQAGIHTRLRDAARRSLWELWQATGETANLGVIEGHDVLYLDCLESQNVFRLVAHIGTRAVFYRTSLGKAIVAFLPQNEQESFLKSTRFEPFTPNTITSRARLEEELGTIRKEGHAVDDEESVIGVRCVAAPILDSDGNAIAAVSIAGPASRVTQERVKELGAAVRATAQEISARLTE